MDMSAQSPYIKRRLVLMQLRPFCVRFAFVYRARGEGNSAACDNLFLGLSLLHPSNIEQLL